MGLWTQWEWLSEAQEGMVKDSWVGKPRVELQSSSRMGLSGWVSKMLSLTGDSGVVSWPGGMGKRDSSSAISSVSNSNEPPATRNRKLLGWYMSTNKTGTNLAPRDHLASSVPYSFPSGFFVIHSDSLYALVKPQ
jgi:hypothetical protein